MKKLLFAIGVTASCLGCSYFGKPTSSTADAYWTTVIDSLDFDRFPLQARRAVKEYYKSRGFRMLWSDSVSVLPVADSMIAIVQSCERLGLIPSDYHVKEIAEEFASPASATRASHLDVLLTDAFFTLFHHLHDGRLDPKTLQRTDLSTVINNESTAVLTNMIQRNDVRSTFERMQPLNPVYWKLLASLREMQKKMTTDSVVIKKQLQLAMNLERLRWEKQPRPERYISVNAPAFLMRVMEKDSIMLESSVIVGKKETPTPELRSVIHAFIIYPYWHVPKSIVGEVLVHIQEDTLYLRKHNYDVLDGLGKKVRTASMNWTSYTAENFPYTLRQREGSENTMGVIKFVFENRYGVYLHDTNARGLFAKEDRALSHGCIRVKQAVLLAHYLAKDDDVYVSPEDLDQYMLLQHRLEVNVAKPIPLFLEYFTCWPEHDSVTFYPDIYDKDAAMIRALYPPLPAI